MTFDEELRRALGRREPPEGFARRVIERAGSDVRARRVDGRRCIHAAEVRPRARAWFAAALVAAASIVVVTGVAREEAARREAAARRAARDLEVALRITSDTLQLVQVKVTHIGEQQ